MENWGQNKYLFMNEFMAQLQLIVFYPHALNIIFLEF